MAAISSSAEEDRPGRSGQSVGRGEVRRGAATLQARWAQERVSRSALRTARCLAFGSLSERIVLSVSSSPTSPESLFLKALTNGLPMIPPGAVDICRRMMVRYSVIYRVTR